MKFNNDGESQTVIHAAAYTEALIKFRFLAGSLDRNINLLIPPSRGSKAKDDLELAAISNVQDLKRHLNRMLSYLINGPVWERPSALSDIKRKSYGAWQDDLV